MSESCKGNRLCQIRRIRENSSGVVDPIFVAGSNPNMLSLFNKNKLHNQINSYIEIKDPMTITSPNQRRDENYAELIDPYFREYFTDSSNQNDHSDIPIEYNCYYRWIAVLFFTFILYLMMAP